MPLCWRILAVALLLLGADASASRRRQVEIATPPATAETERTAESAADETRSPRSRRADDPPLFPAQLPLDMGPLPKGLANASAQGCSACHYEVADQWASSPHATGWRSEHLASAAQEAGTPACLSCHLPLLAQHRERTTYEGGDPSRPIQRPNAEWSPTLHTEGVTCAACHLREGAVIGTRGRAPHPVEVRPALGRAVACASCHQLTWPGAEAPLYDTYGEWSRSAYAKADITCQDCHMQSGHGATHSPARALSVLVQLPPDPLVRGAAPLDGTVVLQNTGAGHAYPTGSPYRGLRLTASLVGPDGDVAATPLTADLHRKISTAPPWEVQEDTRISAGGQQEWPLQLSLPHEASAGAWTLRIDLTPTLRGEAEATPIRSQRIPLRVD